MRQAGIIAAAGVVALDTMVDRLSEDHDNARRMAKGLAAMPGLNLDPESIQSNIVIFEVADRPAPEFINALKEGGVLISYTGGRRVRMVTHYGITAQDVAEVLTVVEAVARTESRAG